MTLPLLATRMSLRGQGTLAGAVGDDGSDESECTTPMSMPPLRASTPPTPPMPPTPPSSASTVTGSATPATPASLPSLAGSEGSEESDESEGFGDIEESEAQGSQQRDVFGTLQSDLVLAFSSAKQQT